MSEEDLSSQKPPASIPKQSPTAERPNFSLPTAPQAFLKDSVPLLLPPNTSLSALDVVALHFVESGKTAFEREEWDRAQEQFERAVSIAPLQPYGYFFLGRIAFGHGDHKQALAFLHKAELLLPPSEQVWRSETANLLGVVYEDVGDYEQARKAYQRCLQLTPTNLKAISAMARLAPPEPPPNELLPSDFLPAPTDILPSSSHVIP
jgi:tetratricopeptide (TPR) repeat protein